MFNIIIEVFRSDPLNHMVFVMQNLEGICSIHFDKGDDDTMTTDTLLNIGAYPPVWVMIISVMLDEMDNSEFKLVFTDPTQSINHDSVMVVYVDDSSAMVNNFSPVKGVDALKSVSQK